MQDFSIEAIAVVNVDPQSPSMSEQPKLTPDSTHWYIVKHPTGTCNILSGDRLDTQNEIEIIERWGPFPSSQEAIARRIGLIRAGKCQPQ